MKRVAQIGGFVLSLLGLGLEWFAEPSPPTSELPPAREEPAVSSAGPAMEGLRSADAGRTKPRRSRPAPSTAGEVRWTFGWPDGLDAQVSAHRRVHRNGQLVFDAGSSWTMAIGVTGGAVEILTARYGMAPLFLPLEEDSMNSALVLQLFLPSLRVRADGRLVALYDFEASQHEIRTALRRSRSPSVYGSSLIESLSGKEALEAMATNQWLTLVEGLAGQEFTFGVPVETASKMRRPLSAGEAELPARYLFVGRMPCFDGDEADRCVWVEATMDFGDSEVRDLGGDRAEKLGIPLPKVQRIIDRMVMVSETATLLPHWLRIDRTATMQVSSPGQRLDLLEEELREWFFSYDQRLLRSSRSDRRP